MNPKSAQYAVERRGGTGAEWARVTLCSSQDYAQLLAATGMRRGLGVSYRVIDRDTGQEKLLALEALPTGA
jgi:hypothetical protein